MSAQGKRFPMQIRPKATFSVLFEVPIACANDPARTIRDQFHGDYRLRAVVDRSALGAPDSHPEDDVCPRTVPGGIVVDPNPDGKVRDRGCGARRADGTLGERLVVDVRVVN